MNYINQFRGLPRQVYYICISRMLIGMGIMIFMFFSLLLTRILGFSEFQAGLAYLVVSLCTVLGAIVGGKLADRYGRKRIFMASIVVSSLIYLISAFVVGSKIMIPLLFAGAFAGSASYPILSAMVADSAPESKRTECFSLLYLSHNLGFAVGPSIGGLLFFRHMNLLFVMQAFFLMCGGFFLYLMTTDVYELGIPKEFGLQEQTADVTKIGNIKSENTFWLLFSRKPLFTFIISLVLLTMCYQMIGFMLPLQLSESFGIDAGSPYSGFIGTTIAVTVVLGTPIVIAYTKKHNHLRTTAIATVLYCIGFGLYAFIHIIPLYYVAVIIWSVGEIMISTGAGVFIAEHSPITHRARFQSLYDMARSLGRGFGPPVFGLMLMHITYRQAWIVDGIACLLIGFVVYLVYRFEKAQA